MQTTRCLNCEAALTENPQFCPSCGQTAHLHRLSVGHIVHDGLHFFFHADKGILTLVRALATKTGSVAKEFIAGKRKKYFPPLNFYLIMAGAVVLSMSAFKTFEKEAATSKQQIEAIAASIPDPVKKARIYTFLKRQNNAIFFVKKYSNMISMFTVPLISLVFYLFYRRGRYNYAEHIIANLYSYGFLAFIFSVIAIPLMSLPNKTLISTLAMGAYFVLDLVYRSVYYYRFMDGRGTVAAFKAAGVTLFAQVLFLVLMMALMFWYIKSGMNGLFA